MKMKRYTLPEEHPIPVGWYPANEEEAVARIEAIEEVVEYLVFSCHYLLQFYTAVQGD